MRCIPSLILISTISTCCPSQVWALRICWTGPVFPCQWLWNVTIMLSRDGRLNCGHTVSCQRTFFMLTNITIWWTNGHKPTSPILCFMQCASGLSAGCIGWCNILSTLQRCGWMMKHGICFVAGSLIDLTGLYDGRNLIWFPCVRAQTLCLPPWLKNSWKSCHVSRRKLNEEDVQSDSLGFFCPSPYAAQMTVMCQDWKWIVHRL